jgi:hypothetical protein
LVKSLEDHLKALEENKDYNDYLLKKVENKVRRKKKSRENSQSKFNRLIIAVFGQDYPMKMTYTTISSNLDFPSEIQNDGKSTLNEEYENFLHHLNHPSHNTSFSKSLHSPKSDLQHRITNKVRNTINKSKKCF